MLFKSLAGNCATLPATYPEKSSVHAPLTRFKNQSIITALEQAIDIPLPQQTAETLPGSSSVRRAL
jgi:hypothetical protein